MVSRMVLMSRSRARISVSRADQRRAMACSAVLAAPVGAQRITGPVAAGDGHPASGGEPAQLAADDLGGGVTDAVELVGGSGAGLECAGSSHSELAQRLDGTVTGLGCGGGVAGQDRSCRRLGIDRVGLAATSPVVTVRLVDLDHVQPPATQMSGQSRTPRAGAFDSDRQHLPEAGDPAGQPPVAAHRGRERRDLQQPAQLVEHDRDMDVFVGVDTGDHTQVVAVCDGGHAALSSEVVGVARTAGRVDKTGSRPARTGASSVTFTRPVVPGQGPLTRPTGQIKDTKRVWPISESDPMSETQPAS
jgi:hypothetical protein